MTAGTNYLSSGGSGTGFFAGRSGDVFSIITDQPTRQLFIAKIPKNPDAANIFTDYPERIPSKYQTNFPLGRDFIEEFWTKQLDFSKAINEEICYGKGMCCSIQAQVTAPPPKELSEVKLLFFLKNDSIIYYK